MTTLYLILAIIVMAIIIVAMGFFWFKSSQKKNKRIQESETKAAEAVQKKEKLQENIEQVLDYDKADKVLVKQREKHVEALVKTKSKGKADEEVKGLMADLLDAYNSL